MTNEKAVAKKDATLSERFMLKVISEFGSGAGEIALSRSQKRLAQNYFHAVDAVLKMAEEKRLKKSGKYQDQTPITWQNVNIESLAVNVVSAARIGWDPHLLVFAIKLRVLLLALASMGQKIPTKNPSIKEPQFLAGSLRRSNNLGLLVET